MYVRSFPEIVLSYEFGGSARLLHTHPMQQLNSG